MCNLADCIKVAADFVSPENIAKCAMLTAEFRRVNLTKVWKEDVLQLRMMMWFAWLSCSRMEKVSLEKEAQEKVALEVATREEIQQEGTQQEAQEVAQEEMAQEKVAREEGTQEKEVHDETRRVATKEEAREGSRTEVQDVEIQDATIQDATTTEKDSQDKVTLEQDHREIAQQEAQREAQEETGSGGEPAAAATAQGRVCVYEGVPPETTEARNDAEDVDVCG